MPAVGTWNRITPSWHWEGCIVHAYLPGHQAALFPSFVGAIDATGGRPGGPFRPITIFQTMLPWEPGNSDLDKAFVKLERFLDICAQHGLTPPEVAKPYKPPDARPYGPMPTIAELLAVYHRSLQRTTCTTCTTTKATPWNPATSR